MAMVDLAGQNKNTPVPLIDISLRQDISISYLEQLFGKLRKGSQVKSIRGPGGGYLLARSSNQIKISDIIVAVDEPIQATRCATGSSKGCTADHSRCLTHDLWSELGNQIFLYLSSITLADVVENKIIGTSGRHLFPANLIADCNMLPLEKNSYSAAE
jgi:Rrf2 family iron-sulfur cluster assembly transcriptional regulator